MRKNSSKLSMSSSPFETSPLLKLRSLWKGPWGTCQGMKRGRQSLKCITTTCAKWKAQSLNWKSTSRLFGKKSNTGCNSSSKKKNLWIRYLSIVCWWVRSSATTHNWICPTAILIRSWPSPEEWLSSTNNTPSSFFSLMPTRVLTRLSPTSKRRMSTRTSWKRWQKWSSRASCPKRS